MMNLDINISAFDKESHAENFGKYRILDKNTIMKWVDIITTEYDCSKVTSNLLMDIGAGVGRFSIPFAISNPNWQVLAIDKSIEMLEKLTNNPHFAHIDNIKVHNADIESFSYSKEAAVIFLSEMLHLLFDLKTSFENIYSTLEKGGFCCIRTVSHSQLSNVEWMTFFDGALNIEQSRTYDNSVIVKTLHDVGFSDIRIINIDESSVFPSIFYYEMLQKKVYSLLHILESDVLEKGYKKLSKYCANNLNCKHTMELSCIIAHK